jgi:hypothetical protein
MPPDMVNVDITGLYPPIPGCGTNLCGGGARTADRNCILMWDINRVDISYF